MKEELKFLIAMPDTEMEKKQKNQIWWQEEQLSPSTMGWPALAEHCATQLAKEEVSPVLVRVVSRKTPGQAEVLKLCPGSRWYNTSLCSELIPKGVVGSLYSEVGRFT